MSDRKVILKMVMSLEGFVTSPDGTHEWMFEWFGDDSGVLPQNAVGVLPAFGSFTGMHRIEPRPGDRIFPVADDVVRAIPALPTRRTGMAHLQRK